MRTRTFLAPTATDVDSYVVVYDEGPATKYREIYLKINDCDRSIKLWFNMNTDSDIKISRAKYDKLKKAIDLLGERVYMDNTYQEKP